MVAGADIGVYKLGAFPHVYVQTVIVYFSKNSRKFATSPSPVLGCYWLYKKLPANRSDCTLALR